ENDGWQRSSQAKCPYKQSHSYASSDRPVLGEERGMGMDNDSVAVQGHEDHEEDTSIESQHVERCHYMTHGAPKGPLSNGSIVGPKRQ
ncbi:hypothetical protein PDJAM_G00003680, partial [Pangasius djambal]|nr:hypothetical protein [Pangasius djambal]